jgi:hypothetical protein
MNRIIDAEEILIKKLNNTKKGEDAALALDIYTDEIKAVIPQMKELMVKYPELRGNTPIELKPLQKKASETALKLSSSFQLAEKNFSRSPQFEKSRRKYYTTLTSTMLE